jgi:triacylglycerol lipase
LDYILNTREESGWSGPVDIVSHSMGTCIVRYLLEVTAGLERSQKVRQLIGLGPPHNGSALAEFFHDPKHGEEIINKLTGIFVPRGFDPVSDRIVQDVRPGSPVMYRLRTAGLQSDITYRIIVTTNPEDSSGFFPWSDRKTWEIADDGRYRATLNGDGVVPHRESVLPGISLDIIPAPREQVEHLPAPDQYCHINLPKNLLVIERIMQYLTDLAGTRKGYMKDIFLIPALPQNHNTRH